MINSFNIIKSLNKLYYNKKMAVYVCGILMCHYI